jgi:glutamate-5-semialdehyde dehydrogenase
MTFSMKQAAQAAKKASLAIAQLSSQDKRQLLEDIAIALENNVSAILAANAQDMNKGEQAGLSDAMLDRLQLDEKGIGQLAAAVRAIASQEDPVGAMSASSYMQSGIQVGKMRIPLGVIAMIYESRPNVTIDAAALCLQAGNALILRGGKEALHSNLALSECIDTALRANHLDPATVILIPDPDRTIMNELLSLPEYIDLIIPRGGEGLIEYVTHNSRIPVIQNYKGVCHLYIDKDADQQKALNLLENGKTQRTGVCNALETLLIHQDLAESLLPDINQLFKQHQVTVHACERSIDYLQDAIPATEEDWHTEYLAMEIAVKVVDSFESAITHIQEYGSGHTDVIATENFSNAQLFVKQVNSAVVMINASSRFSDGGQLGLGAEIGISTSKLHAYGPLGAESLTTEKFVVMGNGQVRS